MLINYNKLTALKQLHADTDRQVIAYNIRQLLNRHNVKVYQLADILSISKANAYEYTKTAGQQLKPSLYNLITLAAYFNIDPALLLNHSE